MQFEPELSEIESGPFDDCALELRHRRDVFGALNALLESEGARKGKFLGQLKTVSLPGQNGSSFTIEQEQYGFDVLSRRATYRISASVPVQISERVKLAPNFKLEFSFDPSCGDLLGLSVGLNEKETAALIALLDTLTKRS